ncbi:MAG TPA: AbrB/MazE/SpoVT family DNA-binding domain-containing protein [Sphingopyxis sp.]|nr:AbrB/MazE/SpoVT family DNA-binding domain-containing protein [Sphingopyxis sp.]HMP46092.1 AbrB/MazE/SpoVT family DNA-binding domain-containing protein [Sphingopyxis sp.]HMQ20347.1 AbrB/MazE/SpoVT family DNA-binding domain-containing protein [Sphingopyxis sp.]
MSYHAKLIKGGKIVIPAELRRELGFKEGDQLVIERDGNALTIKTYSQMVREVQAELKRLIGPYEGSLVDDLIADRRAEAAAEDRQA